MPPSLELARIDKAALVPFAAFPSSGLCAAEIEHRANREAPQLRGFGALPAEMKLLVGALLGDDRKSLASLTFLTRADHRIFGPLAAISTAKAMATHASAVCPARFDRVFDYFLEGTANDKKKGKRIGLDGKVRKDRNRLSDVQVARGLAPIAQSLGGLPLNERAARFDGVLDTVRALPVEHRGASLTGLAGSVSKLPLSNQPKAFRAVLAACQGLADEDRAAVLAGLADSLTVPSRWSPAALRTLLAAAMTLTVRRGDVLATLAKQLWLDPTSFDEVLRASRGLPTLAERADVLAALTTSLQFVGSEHFDNASRHLNRAVRQLGSTILDRVAKLPQMATPQAVAEFHVLLDTCDRCPPDLQPRVLQSLATAMLKIGNGSHALEMFDAMMHRKSSLPALTEFHLLLDTCDRCPMELQPRILQSLAASMLDLDDSDQAPEMFDALMHRNSNLPGGLRGCASVGLAYALGNLPEQHKPQRLLRLIQDHGPQVRQDENLRDALSWVIGRPT